MSALRIKRCRLCQSGRGEMFDLFCKEPTDTCRRIFECTQVKMIDIPNVPSYICEACKSELFIAYNFRGKCIEAEDHLKEQYPHIFLESQTDVNSCYGLNERNYEDQDDSFEDLAPLQSRSPKIKKEPSLEQQENQMSSDSLVSFDEYESSGLLDGSDRITVKHETMETPGETVTFQIEEIEMNDLIEDVPGTSSQAAVASSKRSATSPNAETCAKKPRNEEPKNSAQDNRAICQICQINTTNLKQHMRVHTGEMPFQCLYCAKSFRHRGNLKNHENLHTGDRPYKCKDCHAAFSDPTQRRNHALKHRATKSFMCDECDKTFYTSHFLALHKKTHIIPGQRDYACEHCGKDFYRKNELELHIRGKHTGEKPFVCNFCSKGFAKRSHLKQHERQHNAKKQFMCEKCGKEFHTKASYNKHLQKKHHLELVQKLQEAYECNICNKVLATEELLLEHFELHAETIGVQEFCNIERLDEDGSTEIFEQNEIVDDDGNTIEVLYEMF